MTLEKRENRYKNINKVNKHVIIIKRTILIQKFMHEFHIL